METLEAKTEASEMNPSKIVPRAEWLVAREDVLTCEKELTRVRDDVSRHRSRSRQNTFSKDQKAKKGWLIFFVLSFAFLSSAQAVDTSSRDPKEAPIRELQARMIEAYNNGDVSAAAANFTPDGDLITGTGTHVSTPAGIEHFMTELRKKLPIGTRFVATTVTDVRFPTPDVAVLTSEGGWLYPGETTIAEKNQGIQSMIAARHNGIWHVVLFQRTRRQPPAPAPK